MDKQSASLGLQIGRILAGQRKKPVAWKNMLAMQGKYISSDYSPGPVSSTVYTEFGIGECPLEWSSYVVYSEDWKVTQACSSITFNLLENTKAGNVVEFEYKFPEVSYIGYEGIRLKYDIVLSGWPSNAEVLYKWESDESGLELSSDAIFEECTLTQKQDEQGNIIGFNLRGRLKYDLNLISCYVWTGAFTNTEPFTGTITVKHNSYDDIRFRVLK